MSSRMARKASMTRRTREWRAPHTDGRAVLSCQQRDLKIYRVSGPGADDGASAMYPGAEQISGGIDLHYPRAGSPQLLGDRSRQSVVTGDNDFAMHDLAHWVGTG